MDFHRVVRTRRRNEEVLPLRPAQHHRIGMGVDLDSMRDLPAFADPHHAVRAVGIGAPHASLGVEADAIGADGLGQLRPDTAVGEGAVLLDVEGGQAMADRLTDDEGSSVGGNHDAVRESEFVSDYGRPTIRADEDKHASIDGLGRRVVKVVADVPHVHTAFGVHDPIAQAEFGEVADVGHLLQCASGPAVDLALKRVAHHDGAVGSESEGVRDERQIHFRDDSTGEVHRLDPLVVDVDEPQLAFVPPGTLSEFEALCVVNECLGAGCHGILFLLMFGFSCCVNALGFRAIYERQLQVGNRPSHMPFAGEVVAHQQLAGAESPRFAVAGHNFALA